MKTDDLREIYLAFFETKGCVRRPSDVLVPRWDKSVLFTPAGMNQFKDHFLGKVKLDFTRAASCQKCLRTGDIDNVGKTPYHHTFFEMLGNFSFGDYFKREAIHWAWEFLTGKEWLGLDPDRLSATVYQDDDEAEGIWRNEIKLPAQRVVRCGEEENFWPAGAPSQGPDGVCGPCSEIYYHTDAGSVEIWNLVFTQFNRVGSPPNNLRPLPSKNIDTGMGLERTAAAIQGVDTNFHIDILKPIVLAAAEVCGRKYDPASDAGRRLRRITDHVRACTFAIHENVLPGANEEKYVIRRLLRRAVLDGHGLGLREPFLHKIVPAVVAAMKRPYPELAETAVRVAGAIEQEESTFFNRLDTGLERIERLFGDLATQNRSMVPGDEAAKLYQTYGFPPELVETLAAERNLTFDWAGFKKAMEGHGIESGGGRRGALFGGTQPLDALKKTHGETEFLGYAGVEGEGKIIGIITRNELCEQFVEIDHAQPVTVVLDRSPFYGETGGQVGDKGEIAAAGMRFEVVDTQRDGEFLLHVGHLREGRLALNQHVAAKVDLARRQGIRRAHSATHLLHYALQKHVGPFAQQQGSKVDDDWLRFDFASPKSLTPEQLEHVEDEVNRRVTEASPVEWKTMPLAEARSLGAMMLFGEKYPDVARVVSIGDYSKELCGGTHLDNSGQVGPFLIVSEESVAAGTRRITAVTGRGSLDRIRRQQATLTEIAAVLKAPVGELGQRVASLARELKELKKPSAAATRATGVSAEQLLADATTVGEVKLIAAEVPGGTAPVFRQLIDQLRRKASPIAILLASRDEGKVVLVAGVSRDVEQQLDANTWIRAAAEVVGGSGGGKPDMAQAGGKHPDKLPEALVAARKAARSRLGG